MSSTDLERDEFGTPIVLIPEFLAFATAYIRLHPGVTSQQVAEAFLDAHPGYAALSSPLN